MNQSIVISRNDSVIDILFEKLFRSVGTAILLYAAFLLFFQVAKVNKTFPAIAAAGIMCFFITGLQWLNTPRVQSTEIPMDYIEKQLKKQFRTVTLRVYAAIVSLLVFLGLTAFAIFF